MPNDQSTARDLAPVVSGGDTGMVASEILSNAYSLSVR